MPIKQCERQLWVLRGCNGVQCEGKDVCLCRRQNSKTERRAKIKQSIQTTAPLCWDSPLILRLLAFQNPALKVWPSQPFFPPFINLDKSTNRCLACSICLPHSCSARENLSGSRPASRLSSRLTLKKRMKQKKVFTFTAHLDDDRPLCDVTTHLTKLNFEMRLEKKG